MPNRMFGTKGSGLPFEPHLKAGAVMEPPLTDCTHCVNSSAKKQVQLSGAKF